MYSSETQTIAEPSRPSSAPHSLPGRPKTPTRKTTLPPLPVEATVELPAIPLINTTTSTPENSSSESTPTTPTNSVMRKTSGILTSSSHSLNRTTSTSSLPGHPNIKFAPLPVLPIRKRRSTTPLGVAARGALMRKRRGELEPDHNNHSLGKVEENGTYPRREWREGEDEADPFVALGKMVKGVWRRVSTKGQHQPRTAAVVVGTTNASPVVHAQVFARTVPDSANTEGGVWEEEVGAAFRKSTSHDSPNSSSDTEDAVSLDETADKTEDAKILPTSAPLTTEPQDEPKHLPVYNTRTRNASST